MIHLNQKKWALIAASAVIVTALVGFLKKDMVLDLLSPQKPIEAPKAQTTRNETIDESAYQMVIRSRLSEVQACYNEQLKKGLKKPGKLMVKWTVAPDGNAKDFQEELNELESTELFDCTTTAISHWPFPKNQTFMIRYTFKMKEIETKTPNREVANTTEQGDNRPRDDVQDALGEL